MSPIRRRGVLGFVILLLGLLLAACTQTPAPEISVPDPVAPPVVAPAGITAEVWQQLQVDMYGVTSSVRTARWPVSGPIWRCSTAGTRRSFGRAVSVNSGLLNSTFGCPTTGW